MARENKCVGKAVGGIGGMVVLTTGLALVGFGVFLLLSFATADPRLDPVESAKQCWTGLVGAWMSFGAVNTVGGIPALVLAALVVFWGLNVASGLGFLSTWPRVAGGAAMVASLSMGICAATDRFDMGTGGLFAVYLSPPCILYFGRWGLTLASAILLFLGILLAFGESAVFGVRGAFVATRAAAAGAAGAVGRVADILRPPPGPAVAGAVAGRRPATAGIPESSSRDARRPEPEEDGSGDDGEDDGPASRAADGASAAEGEHKRAARKDHLKVWQPREEFRSRFLDLDLRADPPAPAAASASAAPVAAAIAPEQDASAGPSAAGVADIIMDVDAESEESDRAEDTPSVFGTGTRTGATNASDDERKAAAPMAPAPPPVPVPPVRPVPRAAEAPAPAVRTDGASGGLDGYRLPALELLDPPEPPRTEDRGQLERCSAVLEQTLAEFKIEGRVVHIEQGPRVTMFELSLAPGIRLSKVTSLADNLAMQLKAESVRIIAPIPGKNTIGIEIPNEAKELVSLREVVVAVNREKRRQALPVCLGKDVSGACLVADLARMPHLLIAGATGSGKSVCINSILMSILMCCRPDETQLIMIDPKVVELSRFKDIPHLMSPVITDMKRAVSVLEWICQKMDERYEQMSQVSVNNIAKFNALGGDEIRNRLDAYSSLEEIEAFPKSMPYMVVVIDELADLMMVAGKEVEQHITRLAAKSRAVGIHLILATQRPSVDVITGLIKANMPCRIAFQVASRVDSRTILDQNGAEALLGQGDMLYLPPGVGKLTRAQGVFVSDEELFRVVDFTKAGAAPRYHADLVGPVIGGGAGNVDVASFDDLFLDAGGAIIENQRGSVSLLQRKFGVGYGRASRIIDQLASAGVLGPFRDGKAREILMTLEEFEAKFRGGGLSRSDGSLAGLRDDEREPDDDAWDGDEQPGEAS